MDKFTKGILTVIAVGIIGLNVQMMNGGGFITKANAFGTDLVKVQICNIIDKCADVSRDGKLEVTTK